MSTKSLPPESVEKLLKHFAEDRTNQQIAYKVGCGYATVARYLRAFGLSRNGKGRHREITDDCLVLAAEMRALLDAPSCQTCSDSGAVGNILDVQPCPDCAALAPAVERQELAKWSYCPECGSEEIHHEEGTHKQCAECYQEWFSDLDYTDVVRKHLRGAFTDKDSTIAQLQARIAELESGRGEPVAWRYQSHAGGLWYLSSSEHNARTFQFNGQGGEVEPLFATPPAPVAVVLPERDLLRDKIAEAIGGDTYDCTRVWSAWGVGTMDEDDFVPLIEQEDRLYEIVDACLNATAALNGERE